MSSALQVDSPKNTIVYQRKAHAKVKANNLSETDSTKSGHHSNDFIPFSRAPQYQTLDRRSFWKAGSDDAISAPCYELDEKLEHYEFERARVHPKFLHSNATSHTWAFGAVAELLDNAVDEICNGATFVKIDRIFNPKDNSPVLTFHDDGGGMDPEGIRHCMSLGFSSKKTTSTIGQYGNGFKTSTMRLGADVIVFSCSNRVGCCTQSIGLLSYTYLIKTMKNDIIVPMVDFEINEEKAVPLIYGSQDDWDSNLKTIIDWSPFSSKDELMKQFDGIGSHGTKVLIYNLWYDDEGRLELDFDDDKHDIQLRDETKGETSSHRLDVIHSHISYTYRYSLRSYISILYLREFSNFQIILRGKPIDYLDLTKEMKYSKVVPYRPFVGKDESIETTIGFTKEAPVLGTFGFNIYHRNRLIVTFCKPLLEAGVRGKCVIGVLEANFLEPAHDKQDFERSPLFHRLELKLKQMTADYWRTHCHLIGYQPQDPAVRAKQNQTKLNPAPNPIALLEPVSSQPVICFSPSLQQPVRNNQFLSRQEHKVYPTSNISTEWPQYGLEVTGYAAEADHLAPQGVLDEGFPYDESEMDAFIDPSMVDKLSKENIRLFIMREEHKERQMELKKQVEELERQLEETRRKHARIALEIEIRKRQKITGNGSYL